MKPSIQTKNLTKIFSGVAAVDHLSLSFPREKIIGLIGPNGSGKTTLVNMITGTIPFDEGIVTLQETELGQILPYEVATFGITRTFQNVRLFEQMSVLDNILVILTEREVARALQEKHGPTHLAKAKYLLTMVHLWEKRDELVVNLSYGQRKLLEIARAIAMDTDVIFFDEPFAGLFPEVVKLVVERIKTLKQQGKTVILIEHNMDLIRSLCDYLIVLDAGKLLAVGTPEKVLSRPDVIEAYLGK